MTYCCEYTSPLGNLLLTSDGEALTGLRMQESIPVGACLKPELPVLEAAKSWLDGYFSGVASERSFPLRAEGTPFQKLVWEILLTIPFGSTRTYGDISAEVAGRLGRKTMSSQAVGHAVGRNPLAIIIPCHRVIGAGGKLTGYAGGLDRKVWLLRHEGMKI